MSKQFDTFCTETPVCPHCGHEYSVTDEFNDDGEYACENCEKTFYLWREVSVNFTTAPFHGTAYELECLSDISLPSGEPRYVVERCTGYKDSEMRRR